MKHVTIDLEVNGERRECQVRVERRLLDVLRENFGLTGTKECCGTGDCGACTILLDDRPINSCVYLAVAGHGRRIQTIEGLRDQPEMQRLCEAFETGGAVQCGFCTPGMLVMATSLLQADGDLDEATIRAHLAGNLCRCTGYVDIVGAVLEASRAGAATGSADVRRES